MPGVAAIQHQPFTPPLQAQAPELSQSPGQHLAMTPAKEGLISLQPQPEGGTQARIGG